MVATGGFQRQLAEAKPTAPTTPRESRGGANPSDERGARGGKNERLVTKVECARAQIPDAPLARLRERPA
jgi:hypothetical protein